MMATFAHAHEQMKKQIASVSPQLYASVDALCRSDDATLEPTV